MSEVFQSHWFYEIGPLHEETSAGEWWAGGGKKGRNLRVRSDDEVRVQRVSVIVSHEPLVRGERLTIRLTVSLTSWPLLSAGNISTNTDTNWNTNTLNYRFLWSFSSVKCREMFPIIIVKFSQPACLLVCLPWPVPAHISTFSHQTHHNLLLQHFLQRKVITSGFPGKYKDKSSPCY